MTELSADQKIAIQDYLNSIESKKEERLSGQIKFWAGILGISGVAIITGLWAFLQSSILQVVRDETRSIAKVGEIEAARAEAYKAIYESQADAEVNLDRSKLLIEEIKKSLNIAQQLKNEFRTASEVSAAVKALNDAKQGIVTAIKNDLALQKQILGGVAVPSGIVAAYSGSGTETSCPPDWRLFELAAGRFVVGAGPSSPELTDHKTLSTGGEEMHKLTEAETPNHSHSVYQHAGYNWPDIPNEQKTHPNQGANGGDTTTYVHGGTTGTWGGDLPHNTMPPFVALYYCIKE